MARKMIDPENLKKKIQELKISMAGLRFGKTVLLYYMKFYLDEIMRLIDDEPDISPVKHGKWIYKYAVVYGEKKSSYLFCGECGEQTDDESNYCKHCGALMDAGIEHYEFDMTGQEGW